MLRLSIAKKILYTMATHAISDYFIHKITLHIFMNIIVQIFT